MDAHVISELESAKRKAEAEYSRLMHSKLDDLTKEDALWHTAMDVDRLMQEIEERKAMLTAGESALMKAGATPTPWTTPYGRETVWLWNEVYDEEGYAIGGNIEVADAVLDLMMIKDCVRNAKRLTREEREGGGKES